MYITPAMYDGFNRYKVGKANILCFYANILSTVQDFLFLCYLPYLSFIHEKVNCIAILWMGSPHSLGSCLFQGL